MKNRELILFFVFVLTTTSVLSKKTKSTSANVTDSADVLNATIVNNITEEVPKESEKDTILSQLRILEEQIAFNNKKVQVLERVRTRSADKNHTDSLIDLNIFRDGLSEHPSHSYNLSQQTQTPSKTGSTISDRFHQDGPKKGDPRDLMSKILKKFTFELPQVKEMSYLPVKILKNADEPPVNTLVVFLTANNNLLIYETNGNLLSAFEPKHQVKAFVVNQMTDENFIATLGTDNTIRMHTVNISRVLMEDDTEEKKPKKGDKAKYVLSVSVKLEYIYDLENDLIISEAMCDKLCLERAEQNYNAFSFINIRQLKQFALRSENGNLLVLNRNGTLKGRYEFQGENFLNVQKYHPNPVFATDKSVGFFNLAALDTTKPTCDPPGAPVVKIEPDQYSSNYFYALLANGDILVYETNKQTDFPCRILTRKSIMGEIQKLEPVNIYSTRNFVLVQKDVKGIDLVAYNVTDVVLSGAINFEHYEISLYPLKTDIDKVVKGKYITQRSGYASNTIGAYFEFQNGTSVFSIHEITIYTKSGGEWLDDIRLPLIVLAVLAVVGYQFYNKKKGAQGRGGHRHSHGPGEECNDDHGHGGNDFGSRVLRKDPPGVTKRKVTDEPKQKFSNQELEELQRQYEELQKRQGASKTLKSSKDSKKKVTFEDNDEDEEFERGRKPKNIRAAYEEMNDENGEEDEDYEEEEYEKYYKKNQ